MIPLRWIPIDRRAYPPPRRRMERFPLERALILAMLDNETLYPPSAAAEVGYPKNSPEYIRARRAFSYFANENGIADSFDNTDKEPGEACAWFGSSWKWALGPRMHRVADLMDELQRAMREAPGVQFYLDGERLVTGEALDPNALVAGREHLEPEPASPETIAVMSPPLWTGSQTGSQPIHRSWIDRSLLLIILAILGLLVYLQTRPLPEPAEELVDPGRSLGMPIEFLGPGE